MAGSRCIAERIARTLCGEIGCSRTAAGLCIAGAEQLGETFPAAHQSGLDAGERASLHLADILEREPGELEEHYRLALCSGKPPERPMKHRRLGRRIGRRSRMLELAGSILVVFG